jgi:hypothetical protein
MNRTVGAGVAALMTVTVLSGCGGGGDGGGSSGGYCDDLKATKATVSSLGSNDISQATFDKLASSLHTIADEAPSDISGEWNTLASALDTFTAAMKDAGLTFDNLNSLGQSGGPSIDPAKLQAIESASKALDADAINSASDKINTEVKSECGFVLNIGG